MKTNIGLFETEIKNYPTIWNGFKHRTGIDVVVIHFINKIYSKQLEKDIKLDAVRLNRTAFDIYLDGKMVGPHSAISTLVTYFDKATIEKIENTINAKAFEINNLENTKVYVKTYLDDPIEKLKQEKLQAYWKQNQFKFEQLVEENMKTTTSFYKIVPIEFDKETGEPAKFEHTKIRISTIKTKRVNLDISTIINDGIKNIGPENYITTIWKIDKDSLAWYLASNDYTMDSMNQPTEAFVSLYNPL